MSTDLPLPSVGPLSRLAPKPVRFVLNWGRRYSLWVFNFGLACCAIEFIATSMGRHDFIRLGVIPFAPGPRQADLMVVSGTVSDKMAPAVRRLYEQMPEPKYVISFGACSNCGGPYWDSYCVTKGVDQIVPVDVYVPGCPPRPEALLHGIVRLQEKIAGESLGARYNGGGESVTPPPPPRPLSATVLRRPLQPVPTQDDVPTLGMTLLPEEPAPAQEAPEPAREAPEAAHEAPASAREAPEAAREAPAPAEASGKQDAGTTKPLPPEVAEEHHRPPAGPADVTQPVPPAVEPAPEPEAAPDDATIPVEPVTGEPEARPERRGRESGRRRPRSEDHDPSIIPGLVDDDHDDGGHDDEIGRTGQ